MHTDSDLYELYLVSSKQAAEKWSKKLNQTIEPDDFFTWIIKQGICPYGVINENSRYWIELLSIYDSEMGVTVPLSYEKCPNSFYTALRAFREGKSKKKVNNGFENSQGSPSSRRGK